MLQVARLAPGLLGDAAPLVETFVRSAQTSDGGFRGRDGESDLYYTSFAVDALTALQAELPVSTHVVYGSAFSPDGRWLAAGAADGKIRVWAI